MPQVQFDRIVSCSSEDPAYPATNLLMSKEVNKKWKCKEAGEKSASVIIQLTEPYFITGVDIGNESSSFVEVLVGRTSTPDEFKVLLLMSSFMTPMDARSESNRNRVRMFTQKDLSDSTKGEKWDRIKVVCTQPFNKHLQYGLCFLVLHTSDVKEGEKCGTQSAPLKKLGRFTLKDNDQSDISVGSFFSRRKDLLDKPSSASASLTGAAAVRDASSVTKLSERKGYGKRKGQEDTTSVHRKKLEKSEDSKNAKYTVSTENHGTKLKGSPANVCDATSTTLKQIKGTSSADVIEQPPISSLKGSSHSEVETRPIPDNQSANTCKVTFKPFNKLLEGVEIVISGYVNPGRAEIRDKALQMGAKYKPDWCSSSTHLICAFGNTPKFQQVKGKGVIVNRDWVDECFKQRKHLSWRRYTVDKSDKDVKNGALEPEVWELVPESQQNDGISTINTNRRNNVAARDTRLRSVSSSDSEDEIERIKEKYASKERIESDGSASKIPVGDSLRRTNSSCRRSGSFDGSTDVDSEEETRERETLWMKEQQKAQLSDNLPTLPDFFEKKIFYLSLDLLKEEKGSLLRYITAFGGDVLDSIKESTDFIITKRKVDTKASFTAVHVTPDWIWECNDRGELHHYLPKNKFSYMSERASWCLPRAEQEVHCLTTILEKMQETHLHRNILFEVTEQVKTKQFEEIGCSEHKRELTKAVMRFFLNTRVVFACEEYNRRLSDKAAKKSKAKNMQKLSRLTC